MEIEKKFLVEKLPDNLETYEHHKIAQGYLNIAPVVRIRKADENYYLTYKGAGLMAREEYNLPLTKEAYNHMLPKIDGLLIEKTRFLIPLGLEQDELVAELDVFEGELSAFTMVEVEFTSIEQAQNFKPPVWFGKEVTNDPAYHNSNMSRNGVASCI